MDKFYTKEFIISFLYNELPFSQKRQFVLLLQKDPLLKCMFYDIKSAMDSMKQLKLVKPSEKLVNYIKNYAMTSQASISDIFFGRN